MKELYTTPELLIIPCAIEDILTESGKKDTEDQTIPVAEDTATDFGPPRPMG